MRLEPKKAAAEDPIDQLDTIQRRCYYVAVTAAFVSIFFWAVKILFL